MSTLARLFYFKHMGGKKWHLATCTVASSLIICTFPSLYLLGNSDAWTLPRLCGWRSSPGGGGWWGLYNKQSSRMEQFVVKICTDLCKHHVRGEQQRSVLRFPPCYFNFDNKTDQTRISPFLVCVSCNLTLMQTPQAVKKKKKKKE